MGIHPIDHTAVYRVNIAPERAAGSGADHFAPRESNTRLWNAHEKLCFWTRRA